MVTQTATEPLLRRRRIFGESGLDTVLPYLLLAPTVLLVLAVLVYPLIAGRGHEHGLLPLRPPSA